MASRILLWRTSSLGLGIGLSAIVAAPMLLRPISKPLLCDASLFSGRSPASSTTGWDYPQNVKTSGAAKSGHLNAKTIRQVSAGSIAGLVAGLALNAFSKPLTLLLGLLFMGISFIESRGIHVIPYQRLQKTFRNVDWRSSLERNFAFKLSLGTTLALAAFAEL